MKKFQNMTITTTIAKARFSPNTYGCNGKENGNPSNKCTNGGFMRTNIPVRIPSPKILTTINWINCPIMGFDRESGYVQYRFQIKLLITAVQNDITLDNSGENLNPDRNILYVTKSTPKPIVPTIANFKNRFRSVALLIMLIPSPFHFWRIQLFSSNPFSDQFLVPIPGYLLL